MEKPKGRAAKAGFTLIELSIATLVFWMMVLLFAALYPAAIRGSQIGSSYAQASLIAQHKIDQCRQQGYTNVYSASGSVVTRLSQLSIVDATPAPVQNPGGFPANSVSYSFTGVDSLGSGALVPGSTGTLTIGPPAGAFTGASQLAQVTVTVSWPATGNQASGSVTTHTLIANY